MTRPNTIAASSRAFSAPVASMNGVDVREISSAVGVHCRGSSHQDICS